VCKYMICFFHPPTCREPQHSVILMHTSNHKLRKGLRKRAILFAAMFCLWCRPHSQKRLQCLHHNAHIGAEICLILHTQGCYCCHLGNSLCRIVTPQLGINTLLDFVFTEFWCCLDKSNPIKVGQRLHK
jgi:hypothetical protein